MYSCSSSQATSTNRMSTAVKLRAHRMSTTVKLRAHRMSTAVKLRAHRMSAAVKLQAHRMSAAVKLQAHRMSAAVKLQAHRMSAAVRYKHTECQHMLDRVKHPQTATVPRSEELRPLTLKRARWTSDVPTHENVETFKACYE